MGFGGISIWSLLLILVIVLLLFGTKKVRNMGSDLGGAIRGFKQAMDDGEKENQSKTGEESQRLEEGEEGTGETQHRAAADEASSERRNSG